MYLDIAHNEPYDNQCCRGSVCEPTEPGADLNRTQGSGGGEPELILQQFSGQNMYLKEAA